MSGGATGTDLVFEMFIPIFTGAPLQVFVTMTDPNDSANVLTNTAPLEFWFSVEEA